MDSPGQRRSDGTASTQSGFRKVIYILAVQYSTGNAHLADFGAIDVEIEALDG